MPGLHSQGPGPGQGYQRLRHAAGHGGQMHQIGEELGRSSCQYVGAASYRRLNQFLIWGEGHK
ncbi:hypothetical protein [Hymenobacter coccineus]|uniref:Uncharacterized protein n=1 Tax=Hymenobacter coccineus TaxID=1908235 RepID=A0A1G1SV00_9BACT|nr:hypothetical protein [Hymenobacter coccineus]OGX82428.1 hypothetical protein BEN49_14030 [Hymenobacter coccineus]